MNKEYASSKERKKNTPERLMRFGRNINILGTLAVAGVALAIPGPNVVLAGYAGFNAAQAGGFELLRQRAAKRGQKKN